MANKKWKWKAGFLVSARTGVAFTLNQAYHLIPVNEDIEEACEDVLIPYEEKHDTILQIEKLKRKRRA